MILPPTPWAELAEEIEKKKPSKLYLDANSPNKKRRNAKAPEIITITMAQQDIDKQNKLCPN